MLHEYRIGNTKLNKQDYRDYLLYFDSESGFGSGFASGVSSGFSFGSGFKYGFASCPVLVFASGSGLLHNYKTPLRT